MFVEKIKTIVFLPHGKLEKVANGFKCLIIDWSLRTRFSIVVTDSHKFNQFYEQRSRLDPMVDIIWKEYVWNIDSYSNKFIWNNKIIKLVEITMVPRVDLSDPGVASACLPSSLLGSPAPLPYLLLMGPLLTLRAWLSLLLLLAPVESVLTIVRTIPPTTITGPTPHSLLVPVHLQQTAFWAAADFLEGFTFPTCAYTGSPGRTCRRFRVRNQMGSIAMRMERKN